MRKKRLDMIVLAACVLALSGTSRAMALQGHPPEKNAEPAAYVIQQNDVLEVFVYKEPELTREVFIRPDGKISLPLVQDVQAAGRTPLELKTAVEASLAFYLESPVVTILLREPTESYEIFVLGKVQQPGAFRATKPRTVLQALALAGGFTEFADKSKITIVRSEKAQETTLRFDFRSVIKGDGKNQTILLRSGDVVLVP